MHKPADDAPGTRHTLSDWLALHGLDQATCRHILDQAPPVVAKAPVGDESAVHEALALNPEMAWLRAVAALSTFFPAQQSIIEDTFANSVRTLVDQSDKRRRALTLDNGPTAYPTIVYGFSGEPSDSMTIAHEFAHAVQIRASRGKFVAPIVREVCAFLGEWALLLHAKRLREPDYHPLAHTWRKDDRKYLETGSGLLRSALSQPATPYIYSWNYPISRRLAIRTSQEWSQDRLWTLFRGEMSVADILRN